MTAALGTAIAESSVYGIYHPKTATGLVAKEIAISAVIAFALGVVVQRIWQSNMARWLALLGVLAFAATLRFESTSVLEPRSAIQLAPALEPPDPAMLTLWFVSVRLIAYSFGAFCWATFAPKKTAPVQSHPVEQALE